MFCRTTDFQMCSCSLLVGWACKSCCYRIDIAMFHNDNAHTAEATKRGMGSALLRRPAKLAKLVAGIAEAINLPLTVKVRTGTSSSKINIQEVRRSCV